MQQALERRSRTLFALLLIVATLGIVSCEGKPNRETSHLKIPIYQTDPLSRLFGGDYSGGQTTLGQLQDLGDFGLGTFSDYKGGEMLILGGQIFSIPNPGQSFLVRDREIKTPFAMTTHFRPNESLNVKEVDDYASLKKLLDPYLSPNKNYAIHVDGVFTYLKVQCAQPPSRPGLPFAKIAQDQAELKNVSAQLVGFRMSEGDAKVNKVGYHFHSRTSEGQGGHVLDLKVDRATIRWQEAGDLQVLHP